MKRLPLNHKKIRAEIITAHAHGRRIVAFSCGNATRALAEAGANLISIDAGSDLAARRYISPQKAGWIFGGAFNATSGNLPIYMIEEIAHEIKKQIGDDIAGKRIVVPYGSGELILALSYIHKIKDIIAITSDLFPPTQQDGTSPLAPFIEKNFQIIKSGMRSIEDMALDAELKTDADIFIDTSPANKAHHGSI